MGQLVGNKFQAIPNMETAFHESPESCSCIYDDTTHASPSSLPSNYSTYILLPQSCFLPSLSMVNSPHCVLPIAKMCISETKPHEAKAFFFSLLYIDNILHLSI